MASRKTPSRDDVALPPLPAWQATDEAWRIGLRLIAEVAEAAEKATAGWPLDHRPPHERLDAVRGHLPVDLRERVDSQARKWAMACQQGGLDDLRHEQARMLRAWQAVGQEVAGKPPERISWCWKLANGQTLLLVATPLAAGLLNPPAGAQVWSVEEVAKLIDAQPDAVQAIKATFRGTTLRSAKAHETTKGEIPADSAPFIDDDLDSIKW